MSVNGPKGEMRQLRQEQLGLVKLRIDARSVLTNTHRGGEPRTTSSPISRIRSPFANASATTSDKMQ